MEVWVCISVCFALSLLLFLTCYFSECLAAFPVTRHLLEGVSRTVI